MLIAALYVLFFVGGLGAWPVARAQLCPSILIASSSEKAGLMTTLAGEFSASNRNTWAGCGNVVQVEEVASGEAERNLEQGWPDASTRPDVWAPAATTWVDLLAQRVSGTKFASEIPPQPWQSIASSPLVIAMPDVMAKALGWPGVQPSWSELLQLAASPKGWAAKGHPEFGPFRLGKTDPTKSTSGIHTLIAEYYAATGGARGGLTIANIGQPDTQAFLAHVEASVSHYAPTARDFLRDLSALGGASSYISAIPVEEQEVFNYNIGKDSSGPTPPPLDPIYPTDGTVVADHPYLVLNATWVDDAKRAIARDFEEWLLRPDQQARFAADGFRDFRGRAGRDLTDAGILAPLPSRLLEVPAGPVLDAIVGSWATFRKAARILIVLAVDTAGERQAVRDATRNLGAADAVGVMVPPENQLIAVTGLQGGRTDVERTIESAPLVRGPTALYATIKAAYDGLSGSADPSRINAVVVIASVPNSDAAPTLITLQRELLSDKATVPVRIYTVALESADRNALTTIERAAGGYVTPSLDPSSAIRTCLANF